MQKNLTVDELLKENEKLREKLKELEISNTRLKITEEELIKARQRAEDADNLKSDFLANMSHEIRTPMNGILGFAELLKDADVSGKKKHEYIERINSCGKHLLCLINDIIDLSKIEAGKINIIEKEFSLSALFFDLFFFFQAENARNEKDHIELKMHKEIEDDKGKIIADITRLRQILTNLIGNAVKFTSKGQITFGYTFKDSNTILFYVKDTGIGIPSNKLNVIFDRFRQADSSTTRKFGGTGLGLAISKGLVSLLGGSIWVESEEGEGSTFNFTIPYKTNKENYSFEKNTLQEENQYKWNNKNILIVEDDETSYTYLTEILRKTKIQIHHAKNGKEAIEICKSIYDIDLVLMDIQLQGISGYETTKKIKQLRKDLPIIAQTANAMDDDRRKCIEAGCDDYISKPIDKNILLKKINKVM